MLKLNIFGTKVEIPEYKECPRCGTPESCKYVGPAYEEVCSQCQNDPAYIESYNARTNEINRTKRAFDSLDNNKPSAVWNYKDQRLYTNKKGDIINQESAKRPLKSGRQK